MKEDRHWLYRPQNLPRLWKWGSILLLLCVAAQWFVKLHAGFGFADWFAFNAVFGFFSCLVMVVFAKWLGGWVKRPQDYYDQAQDQTQQPGAGADQADPPAAGPASSAAGSQPWSRP